MTPFAKIIAECGISLLWLSERLNIPYATLVNWSSGKVLGSGRRFSKMKSTIQKLEKLKEAQDAIFGEKEE